jgi:hypothetical protein
MKPRHLLFALSVIVVLFSGQLSASEKPNILLLYAEDLGYGDLGYGDLGR